MSDSITSTITIDAPLDQIWELASEPGWWVDDTEDLAINPSGGNRTVGATTVRRYGDLTFPVQVLEIDAPRRVVFRWASAFSSDDLTDDNSTRIELTLEQVGDQVLVTVVESGFDRLPLDDAARDRAYEANNSGWNSQLELLRTRATRLHQPS